MEPSSQENTNAATMIFHDCFDIILVPSALKRREAFSDSGSAFLMVHNCSAHTSDKVEELRSNHRIARAFLPADSSSQTKVIDLSILSVTEGLIARQPHGRP
jgi:hypothetical protein